MSITKENAVGGQGGFIDNTEKFEIVIESHHRITGLHVYSDLMLDGIGLIVNNESNVYKEFRVKGKMTLIPIDRGKKEFIKQVHVYYGNVIDRIAFDIAGEEDDDLNDPNREGRWTQFYGRSRGGPNSKIFSAKPGEEICGFHGKKGVRVDTLGVFTRPIPV
ncbi:MAG: hypothetical protein QNJ54_22070 [Prochloraceae cyanobacterium]|nr:hypothetical protein [Prochloraceae cyanobacterium]